MLNEYKTLVNYIKLHKISLEQDQNELQLEMDLLDMESDEYKDKEIQDTFLNGQIGALGHILDISDNLDLTSPITKE